MVILIDRINIPRSICSILCIRYSHYMRAGLVDIDLGVLFSNISRDVINRKYGSIELTVTLVIGFKHILVELRYRNSATEYIIGTECSIITSKRFARCFYCKFTFLALKGMSGSIHL